MAQRPHHFQLFVCIFQLLSLCVIYVKCSYISAFAYSMLIRAKLADRSAQIKQKPGRFSRLIRFRLAGRGAALVILTLGFGLISISLWAGYKSHVGSGYTRDLVTPGPWCTGYTSPGPGPPCFTSQKTHRQLRDVLAVSEI